MIFWFRVSGYSGFLFQRYKEKDSVIVYVNNPTCVKAGMEKGTVDNVL